MDAFDDSDEPKNAEPDQAQLLAELRREVDACRAARQQLESALFESNRAFKTLVHGLPEKVFHKNRNSVYVSCNRNYAVDFGLEPEDMIGKTDFDLFPYDIAAKYRADDGRIMATGVSEEIEEKYFTPDGQERIIRTVKTVMRNEEGEVTGILGIFSDITVRKRSEEAMRAAHSELEQSVAERIEELARVNDELHAIYDGMTDGLLVADVESKRLVRANAAIGRMLGYSTAELLSMSVTDVHPAGSLADVLATFNALAQRSPPKVDELPFLRRDGSVFFAEVSVNLLESDGRRYMAGFFRDITERKRIEAALRESEERYKLVARGAGVGVWDWDLRTGKVFYSPRWKALFGYDEAEIGDRLDEWTDRLHPDEREQFLKTFDEFLGGDAATKTIEYRFRHKTGMYRWTVAHALAVRDEHGRACRVVGSLGDITDRKRAEEALRRSESRYRALIESCPDAVAMIDLQGRICFASERAAQLHGFPHPDDMVGLDATELVIESDRERFRTNVHHLAEGGIRTYDEYLGARRDGTTFEAEISSALIRDAVGNAEGLMGVYRDVTERKQTESKFRTQTAELLAAAEIQARLLPQESPRMPGFDIAGRCYSAEATEGDHFDFLKRPEGSLLVVLGDVSGHGIGPAIVAADFCARLRTLAESPYDLTEIAAKVNEGLYRETASAVFVTAILGRLDPISQTLTCVNAGHPPALVLNAAGEIKARLSAGGLPFAVLPVTPYVADDPVELSEGDLLFFHTDGLTDVRREREPRFGLERAIEVIRANRERTADEIIESLHRAVIEYAGSEKFRDDVTLVVIKVLGSP